MSGSLIKIFEDTTTSAVADVSVTGITTDYDVYRLDVSNLQPVVDNKNLTMQFLVAGSPDNSANYDHTRIVFGSSSASAGGGSNATSFTFAPSLSNVTYETANATLWLFNFANSAEYSLLTADTSAIDVNGNFYSYKYAVYNTVAQACNGVYFYMESAVNIASGAKFTLYGLKK